MLYKHTNNWPRIIKIQKDSSSPFLFHFTHSQRFLRMNLTPVETPHVAAAADSSHKHSALTRHFSVWVVSCLRRFRAQREAGRGGTERQTPNWTQPIYPQAGIWENQRQKHAQPGVTVDVTEKNRSSEMNGLSVEKSRQLKCPDVDGNRQSAADCRSDHWSLTARAVRRGSGLILSVMLRGWGSTSQQTAEEMIPQHHI